jgi:hypothetical protein
VNVSKKKKKNGTSNVTSGQRNHQRRPNPPQPRVQPKPSGNSQKDVRIISPDPVKKLRVRPLEEKDDDGGEEDEYANQMVDSFNQGEYFDPDYQ